MPVITTYSTGAVSNSITSSDTTTNTKDNIKPYSFLEFINATKVDYTPEDYNQFYITYLQKWTEVKNSVSTTTQVSFVGFYIDFLKEIVLTYTTTQEKKFLSKLDFTDPVDLDVAMPFFVDKIRQIVIFYKGVRDDAKYTIDKNKSKGTNLSVEKALFENIYKNIFGAQDDPQYYTLGVTLSSIAQNLKIDVEEYVDIYGNYFDIPEDVNKADLEDVDVIRKTYYDANINPIDIELFFGNSYTQLFGNISYLLEIPLIANVSLQFDPICEPNNPLTFAQSEPKCGLSTDEISALKKRLLEKFIGVDLHYIDTTSGSPVSGILVKSESPTKNIPNLQAANVAAVQSGQSKLLRNLGLFFKPDNQGIFQLNANKFTYVVDSNKLDLNKIYVYPDPSIYGNVLANNQADYPLVYIYDYLPEIKSQSSGIAWGDPTGLPDEQSFIPYYSTQQDRNKLQNGIDLNFSDLYNEGFITRIQYDIYGNEYALFKDKFGETFKTRETLNSNNVLNLLLDGHVFYDYYEGYNFDYSAEGVDGITIRSGLSTHTVVDEFSSTLSSFDYNGQSPLTLYFREFLPYTELIQQENSNSTCRYAKYRDCNGFKSINDTELPDPIKGDLNTWPANSLYYYSELVDSGISSLNPLTRGTLTLPADFTLNVPLSSAASQNYDCGFFAFNYELAQDMNYRDNVRYFEGVDPDCATVLSTLTGNNTHNAQKYKDRLQGQIYVKNQTLTTSYGISSMLYPIFSKYSNSVKSEVYSSPVNLEVFYDVICIETPSYVVFDKIRYEGGEFFSPNTKNTYVTRASSSAVEKFSNRFFNEVDKKITFCTVSLLSSSVGNNQVFIPTIYQYSTTDFISKQVFPLKNQASALSGLFTLQSYFTNNYNFSLVKINNPVITYNSLNDVYKLTYTGTDNNNLFHLFDFTFNIDVAGVVNFTDSKYFKHNKSIRTTDFSTNQFTSINQIQGTTYTTASGSLII